MSHWIWLYYSSYQETGLLGQLPQCSARGMTPRTCILRHRTANRSSAAVAAETSSGSSSNTRRRSSSNQQQNTGSYAASSRGRSTIPRQFNSHLASVQRCCRRTFVLSQFWQLFVWSTTGQSPLALSRTLARNRAIKVPPHPREIRSHPLIRNLSISLQFRPTGDKNGVPPGHSRHAQCGNTTPIGWSLID